MVAMVAMANHRADSPKTDWRIGVDTSRSTTHRVCESEHAFTSRGAAPNSERDDCPRRSGQRVLRTRRRRGGDRRARFYLKPAAKSVATCTAAALSRSDRSLS